VKQKIGVLLSRVNAVEVLLDSPISDDGEEKRRNDLLRFDHHFPTRETNRTWSSKIKQIEAQLRSLYEKGSFPRFAQQAEDDEASTRLLEDLREAIADYQASSVCNAMAYLLKKMKMTQQMAIFDQSSRLIVRPAL